MLIDIGRSWRLSVYGCVGVCEERERESGKEQRSTTQNSNQLLFSDLGLKQLCEANVSTHSS